MGDFIFLLTLSCTFQIICHDSNFSNRNMSSCRGCVCNTCTFPCVPTETTLPFHPCCTVAELVWWFGGNSGKYMEATWPAGKSRGSESQGLWFPLGCVTASCTQVAPSMRLKIIPQDPSGSNILRFYEELPPSIPLILLYFGKRMVTVIVTFWLYPQFYCLPFSTPLSVPEGWACRVHLTSGDWRKGDDQQEIWGKRARSYSFSSSGSLLAEPPGAGSVRPLKDTEQPFKVAFSPGLSSPGSASRFLSPRLLLLFQKCFYIPLMNQ